MMCYDDARSDGILGVSRGPLFLSHRADDAAIIGYFDEKGYRPPGMSRESFLHFSPAAGFSWNWEIYDENPTQYRRMKRLRKASFVSL